jgi:hypothetical protein
MTTTTPALDSTCFPQTTSVQKWIEEERVKGLVDIKFFARTNDNTTLESFSGEVNQMRAAATICRQEAL